MLFLPAALAGLICLGPPAAMPERVAATPVPEATAIRIDGELNDAVWQTTRERYRLGKRWDPYVVYDRLKAILDGQGTPLLDPREALRATETSGPPAYYTRDVHWNAVGNAVAADGLLGWVQAQPTCRPGTP